ncbi:hypothetical protein AB3Y40_06565 [Yoonia sp. R2331]|uniref:hypothetical protein n=1 Tax=Yoonia sp. R2331 TaxID=3237238 RepID=UPI0034E4AE8A
MSDQMAGFHTRIKRIKDPKNTYYVDGETGTFIPKRVNKQQIKQAAKKRNEKATFGGLVMALILGAVMLMGARFVRWTYLGIDEAGTTADTLMLIDFGMAAMAIFILGGMIGQKSLAHMTAQVAGIACMLVTMHNLIWLAPAEFAQVFGQDYVNQVQATTAPTSLYVRGETILIPLA